MKRRFARFKYGRYQSLIRFLIGGPGRRLRFAAWWLGLPIVTGCSFALDGYRVRLHWTRGFRQLPRAAIG